MTCYSSEHNKRSECYDGRVEVVRTHDGLNVEKCVYCGEEWIQLHARSKIECDTFRKSEVEHVRSGCGWT